MVSDIVSHSPTPRTPAASTDAVCAFYTTHPYPPPVENLDRARDDWADPNRARAEFHLLWPDRPYRADLDILIAGCGTWQAAKYALCRPAARIVGIDVSTTSLDHTEQLKRRYNLTNLELRQLPIEEVEALDRRFDLVVCTGVLHHLASPEVGLGALRAMLKTDGAMQLMVYARYGRAGVSMLQEYCRRLGLGPADDDIDDLMTALHALPSRHAAASLLANARDLADRHALADALLNPRERSYSVPELFDLVEGHGLTFGRWQLQAPYLPQCGGSSPRAHVDRLLALPALEQYAAMELWRGTMAHHSAVLYRSDATVAPGMSAVDDERWLRDVPVRLPATISVQERLPAGAAAVLLNRGHLHHDLIVPIGADQKRLFDAIDGHRSIAEIVAVAGSERTRPLARPLFETLWWYDQVVFDRSQRPVEA